MKISKTIIIMSGAALISGLLLAGAVFAGDAGMRCGGERGHSVEGKAALVLKHQEMFNLSSEQIAKLEELDLKTKKDCIRADAEIAVAGLDLKAELKKDVIDMKAVGKILDQKYTLKKDKTKLLINTYAAIKTLLTPEQRQVLKKLEEEKTMTMAGGFMGGGQKTMPMRAGGGACPMKGMNMPGKMDPEAAKR